MKLWQKVLVVNVAGLLGIASSLFVLPANTPFFPWLMVSVVMLATFNVMIIVRHRKIASGSRPTASKATTIIIALGTAIWILDILVHVLRR
jgi:hypothetical protein